MALRRVPLKSGANASSPGPAEEDQRLHRPLLSTAIASGEACLLDDAPPGARSPLRLTFDGVRAKQPGNCTAALPGQSGRVSVATGG